MCRKFGLDGGDGGLPCIWPTCHAVKPRKAGSECEEVETLAITVHEGDVMMRIMTGLRQIAFSFGSVVD